MASYITIIDTIGYQTSKQGTYFQRSIAMFFDETTNYDFILPSKTCQCHRETTATNAWISCKEINRTLFVSNNSTCMLTRLSDNLLELKYHAGLNN